MELTQDILKELLHYDPDTGVFTWLERDIKWFGHCRYGSAECDKFNNKHAGNIAGCVHTQNGEKDYIIIGINILGNKKRMRANILAHLYMTGEFPNGDIDHVDGNGINNSWKNLRDVSHQENGKNCKLNKDNTSGFNGVTWDSGANKWRVQLRLGKRCIYGGIFENIEDAIEKRKQMNIEHGYHKNHGRR